MPWNGSGSFSRTNGTNTGSQTWQNDRDGGTKIRSDRHDTHDQDIADAISACLTKNNETKPTSHFLPNTDNTYNLGSASLAWKDVYIDGVLNLSGTAVTPTAAEINGLGGLTASRAVATNGSGILTASSVTSTELGYISGVTSAIQTQLNAKAATTALGLVFLSSQTASNSANISFTTGISSTYDLYVFELLNVLSATNGTDLQLLVSTDGGSTYVTSSDYIYARHGRDHTGTALTGESAGDSSIRLADGCDNTAANGGVSITVKIRKPSNTTHRKSISWTGDYRRTSGFSTVTGSGQATASSVVTGDIDAIRFQFSSGNITSGDFYLYGVRKS